MKKKYDLIWTIALIGSAIMLILDDYVEFPTLLVVIQFGFYAVAVVFSFLYVYTTLIKKKK